MGLKRTDEFRADAVRIALTSGLTRKQVADDLGVGMSTLTSASGAERRRLVGRCWILDEWWPPLTRPLWHASVRKVGGHDAA